MKTPIAFNDIKPGDLIRSEWSESPYVDRTAVEYRVNNHKGNSYPGADRHYLLDRPTPPVSLPEEDHHFGWLTAPDTLVARDRVAGEWFFGGKDITASGFQEGIARARVTEWIPGTLVPTEALGTFRHLRQTRNLTMGEIDAFIAAIDEANQ